MKYLMRREHDFWGSIEPGDDVFSEVLSLLFAEISAEPEVTKKELLPLDYHIFKSQFSFNRMLLGFRSRWIMSAVCMYLKALRTWYRKY